MENKNGKTLFQFEYRQAASPSNAVCRARNK